ncbi:MAG: hypothetical protein ACREBJ_09685 [Nitrosotalea sp.]
MTQSIEAEIEAIRKHLFRDNVYVILYEVKGQEALDRIKDVDRRGAKAVMETLLQLPALKTGDKTKSTPWGRLDHTYALGDYTLAWSRANQYLRLVETVNLEDPYANV